MTVVYEATWWPWAASGMAARAMDAALLSYIARTCLNLRDDPQPAFALFSCSGQSGAKDRSEMEGHTGGDELAGSGACRSAHL